jgi:molybdenum cofactor cytidylyltransferase
VADPLGAILAHGVPVASLGKGTVLGDWHIASLQTLGIKTVTVAHLEDDDIGEDEAATKLAHALVPDPDAQYLRITKAGSGRTNIKSMRAGWSNWMRHALRR